MSDKMRHISLDVCDMQRNKLCNIYDSSINAKGQAYDIIRTREITGGNTLTFNMPFVVEKKRNFRWNYIKNEYLLRLKIDDKTDWYIIHSPKKMKNSKTISNAVACGHLSTTLKTKSLYLVFDDENGIGTIQYLLEQVLKGTGWTLGLCDTFYEKDGKTEKIRSIASEGKAGAQKLIADICTLFNAYPTYNGEEKTVDIRAMGDKGALFEMTMGRDIESLAVEYNSEDIITRLYVEGEYGEDGYVGIDDVNPTGLTYQMNFDYYKEIGSFTDEHQAALDKYYEDIAAANEIIRRVATEIGDKENTLNTYWGQIDYVLYPIANGVIAKRIVGGNVDGEDLDIAEGDEVTILQGDGEYRETTAGTGADIGLTATDTYAIKFITLPAGLIGAKQVSIEAKEKQIEELRSKITDATSDAKKTDYNNRIAAYLAEIEEIYNGSEEVTGLYAMMHAAVALCMELYEINAQRTQAQEDQEQIEADFAIAMGDMLKEGYWNNENYAAGQEQFLYEDAVDMMELMSKPEVKYQVSRLSLAGQYGYTPDDIDLNMRIRVYDTDLKINDILYVSAVGEHLCSAKDDTVDLSNEDITLSGQTLDSLLTRMTKLADLIEQKNALFSRASAITENGSIHMDRLEGTINVLKNQLSSAVSSWYTDANGNLIFESTTGKSAMMLTGDGFMIANGKLDDGSWNWRSFGTGEGFTADAIVTGYLSADRIEANSITVNKLASDVGQSLDLSSNESIKLTVENTVTNKLSAAFISVSLNKNLPTIQIHDPNTGTYTPNWTSTAVNITPSVLIGGVPVANTYAGLTFAWTRQAGSTSATSLISGESVTNGVLTVSKNLLSSASGNTITYRCTATYVNEYGSVSETADVTFSLVEDGVNGETGDPGRGISEVINYYLRSDSQTGITYEDGWDKTPPEINTEFPYLWNYEEIAYSNGDPSDRTTPCVIGRYGTDGDQGDPGVGIDYVEEWYAKSGSNTTAPTSWDDTPPVLTTTDKYLWNYEIIYYTDGTSEPTDKRIIGVYGDTGRGISKVNNYYLASASDADVSVSDNGWTLTIQTADKDKPYLWNYEEIIYTQGNPDRTDPCIIGIYTEDGVGITSVDEEYAVSTSATAVPTKWYPAPPDMSATNKYLWNRETIHYSQGDPKVIDPIIIGVYGDTGKPGVTYYTWIKYADDASGTNMSDTPEGKAYLGLAYNKTSAAESTNASDYSWSKIIGETGKKGDDGTTYYTWVKYADDASGTNMSNDPTDKYYIGLSYDNTSPEESNNASDYVWSLFRGSNGPPGENAVSFAIYAPEGSTFTLDVTSLTISAMAYKGSEDILSSATLKWETNADGTWTTLSSTGSSITVSASDVHAVGSYRCTMTYAGLSYVDSITLTDETDQIVRSSTEPQNPEVDTLWLDTSLSGVDVLKRWDGNAWVETTLSQEEIANIQTSVSEAQSEILVLDREINLRVKTEDMTTQLASKADSDWVTRSLETLIEQTAKDITFQFNQSISFTEETVGPFNEFIEEVKSYQRFTAEGLELGKINNPFIAKLTNEKLSFIQDGIEVAYIQHNKLYITEAQVTDKMSIGTDENGYFEWSIIPDKVVNGVVTVRGGMALKWKG